MDDKKQYCTAMGRPVDWEAQTCRVVNRPGESSLSLLMLCSVCVSSVNQIYSILHVPHRRILRDLVWIWRET
jgi:hypothetical protein